MPHVQRSKEAGLDLQSIASHIAQDNPPAALDWLNQMERLFSALATRAQMGERMRTRRFGIVRRISHGNCVGYFRPLTNGVEILRVTHGARDQDKLV
jgi:plasmid stabilization system protein ParE